MMDASSTSGQEFVLAERRSSLFGLVDLPPGLVGGSLRAEHIGNRSPWPRGQSGRQVSWSHHGRVRILELHDGRRLAAWCDETRPVNESAS